jgi:hypothetical protein
VWWPKGATVIGIAGRSNDEWLRAHGVDTILVLRP